MKQIAIMTIVGTGLLSLATIKSTGQGRTSWNNRNCAVSLTYDDALNVDLDNAIPVLDSLGLKGTFYLSGYSGALKTRLEEWRTIAKNGHELANHTLYHPCTGKKPGREFVTADYDLSNYTFQRLADEIKMTNTLLKAIDGKTERTFAYPCGDTKIGDSSYIGLLKNDFIAARGVQYGLPKADAVDLYNISCYSVNGQSGEELVSLLKKAIANKAWIVFLFHGVGGGHSLNVSLTAHSQLLHFIKQNQGEIWAAPLLDIAKYVGNQQRQSK